MMNKNRTTGFRTLLAVGGALAFSSALVFACSSSSTTTTPDSGGGGTGTGTGTGHGSSGTGTGVGTGTGTGVGTGTGTGGSGTGTADAGTTLYERLGGHAGIRSAVNAVVTAELMNADIASYFFYQTTDLHDGGIPQLGHPTAGQIEECFTDFVGGAAGGPEQYPTTLAADAGGPYTCRSLTTAHRDLQIDQGTFTTFLTIAGGVLTGLGVAPNDVLTLAGALEGTEGSIVTIGPDAATDAQPFPGSVDAALKLDSTY